MGELPYILWAHRTTPRSATSETPFSLTYGFEARLPVEPRIPTTWEDDFELGENEEAMEVEMEFRDEHRD